MKLFEQFSQYLHSRHFFLLKNYFNYDNLYTFEHIYSMCNDPNKEPDLYKNIHQKKVKAGGNFT